RCAAVTGVGAGCLEKIADRSGFRDARGNRRARAFWRSWFQHARTHLGPSDRRDQRNGERLSRTRNKNSPAESRHGQADVSLSPEPKRRRNHRSCEETSSKEFAARSDSGNEEWSSRPVVFDRSAE